MTMSNTYIQTREDLVRKMRSEHGYGESPKERKGHFPLRLSIAAFLFLLYFAGTELSLSYKSIDSGQIANVIAENEDLSFWQERLQSVFNQLN